MKENGKIDFHSLRHTFGTILAASGIHPKTAQELMRHSDINLTMSRYSHTLRGQEAKAIESLPDFDAPISAEAIATGTDDNKSEFTANYSANLLPKDCRTFQNIAEMTSRTDNEKTVLMNRKSGISLQNQAKGEMGRGGFEPPTHGFSVR